MYKICIINKNTRECVDVQYIENDTDWTDTDELIRCESNEGEIGDFWNGNGWLSYDEWSEKQRLRRNKFLSIHIDIINAIRWEAMTQQEKDDWSSYRQALLDVPQQQEFPRNIIWPTKP